MHIYKYTVQSAETGGRVRMHGQPSQYMFAFGTIAPSGPGPHHSRGF